MGPIEPINYSWVCRIIFRGCRHDAIDRRTLRRMRLAAHGGLCAVVSSRGGSRFLERSRVFRRLGVSIVLGWTEILVEPIWVFSFRVWVVWGWL